MNKIIATAAALMASTQLAFAAPEVGKMAPDFIAKDTTGKEITLSALKGKFVVLEWTNPGCPFVRKFYSGGAMQKLQQDYTAKGVEWIRINSSAAGKEGNQTAEEANKLAAEQNAAASATILDADGAIGRLYDAKTTPHMFIIGKGGSVVYMGAIDSERSPDPEDIEGAENYVASALDALLAGGEVKTPVTQPYGCSVKY